MSYEHATISKAANIYHGGKVSSRSIVTEQGESKTLGLMLAGDYSFTTDAPECMEILAGSCRVRLDGERGWQTYQAGDSFNVVGHSHFDIEVTDILDYICHFE